MKVVDANLLLYAYNSASPFHPKAKKWVTEAFSGEEAVGLPWQVLSAFLRLVTSSKLTGISIPLAAATDIVASWLEQPNVQPLTPGPRHWPLVSQVLHDGQARGPLVTDALLAALTMEYGGVLYTSDRDFARFPGLRWQNPLL